MESIKTWQENMFDKLKSVGLLEEYKTFEDWNKAQIDRLDKKTLYKYKINK